MRRLNNQRGYTIVELMLVAAIIALLAAVGMPKFSGMLAKTQEGATKGNLATIRSALAVYYGETEGTMPRDLQVLTVDQRYLKRMPYLYLPSHS
jgi:prepilin-type N-terminal cleavage/methylation domain-containing protein